VKKRNTFICSKNWFRKLYTTSKFKNVRYLKLDGVIQKFKKVVNTPETVSLKFKDTVSAPLFSNLF
jgi:hypothetical protein